MSTKSVNFSESLALAGAHETAPSINPITATAQVGMSAAGSASSAQSLVGAQPYDFDAKLKAAADLSRTNLTAARALYSEILKKAEAAGNQVVIMADLIDTYKSGDPERVDWAKKAKEKFDE